MTGQISTPKAERQDDEMIARFNIRMACTIM